MTFRGILLYKCSNTLWLLWHELNCTFTCVATKGRHNRIFHGSCLHKLVWHVNFWVHWLTKLLKCSFSPYVAPLELLPSFEATVLGPTAVEFSWKPPASSPHQVNSSYNSTLSCYTKLNQTHNQMVLTQEYNSEDTGMTVVQLDGFLPSTTYTCNVTIFSTIEIELSVQASRNLTTLCKSAIVS